MNAEQKRNAEYAFSQINLAFGKLGFDELKNYHLILGNGNEVHMLKNDGSKSIFLGRLIINSQEEMKPVVTNVWATLQKVCERLKAQAVKEVKAEKKQENHKYANVQSMPKKKLVKKSLAEEVKEEQDDSFVADQDAEDAFDAWADKM